MRPKKCRVLVVDDNEMMIKILEYELRYGGYQVTSAFSAKEALHIIECNLSDPFALALLDMNMPGISGLTLAKHLQNCTDIPFMFLSASDDPSTVTAAAEVGALGYMVKNGDFKKLLPNIEAGLARAAEIAALRKSEAGLTTALNNGRETSIAIGILMERFKITRVAAFELMRDYSRSKRTKVADLASDVIGFTEIVGGTMVTAETHNALFSALDKVRSAT